jgi:catalase
VSVERTSHDSIKTRKVAALIGPGFSAAQLNALKERLLAEGALLQTVSQTLNPVAADDGSTVVPDKSYRTGASVLFDAIYIPGGAHIDALKTHGDVIHFINEAFRQAKPIGATGEAVDLLEVADIGDIDISGGALVSDRGVVTSMGEAQTGRKAPGAGDTQFIDEFIAAMKLHRFFVGRAKEAVPA